MNEQHTADQRSPEHAWAVDYLNAEARRVVVDDTFAEIVRGVRLVRVAGPDRELRRRSSAAVALMSVAAAALVVGLAALVFQSSPPQRVEVSSPGGTGASAVSDTAATTAATTTTIAPTTTVPANQLPAGGMWLAGQVPTCTAIDEVTYDCTLSSSYDPAGDPPIDITGLVTDYVDVDSNVAGGCRATSANGRRWACYVGQRAVDEQIIGANILGHWSPREFAAG